ncbi:phosphotransferase family protein [Nocardia jinanensis]|uniref:Acyl-CoA dehydrogenase n=1 Tax=Nocardia jinanensis TaxID=382504 RepID=A0A917RMS6_9NOCA|nr:phosphotransferase family protein [Nocardia jinanensis]GGL15410.1 acyl-CoA dehydrogenase [Nocardia jinanensis]
MSTPGMDVAALRRYLIDAGVPVRGELRVELISGGRSNLTFKAYDDESTWVVRRPPTSGLTPSAHDMSREYTVAGRLQGTPVPVARTVTFDSAGTALGAPMTVVEYVDGLVIRDRADLAALTDAQVEAAADTLVSVLVDLHAVDYQAIGLGGFGRPDGFLARQIALWARQWERVKTRELPDVAALHAALSDAVPAHSAASIIHGDFRIDNTILDAAQPNIVRAAVDWELSTLGDPLTDIALMCVYRTPSFDLVLGTDAAWTSPRLPAADELAHRYATRSGRDLGNWNFYTALANFKLGVIGEGIAHRALRGSDVGGDALRAAEVTAEFMAAGLRALS